MHIMGKRAIWGLLLCGCLIANAQSKIDFTGQRELRRHALEKRDPASRGKTPKAKALGTDFPVDAQADTVAVVVTLEDGAGASDLEAGGGEVIGRRGDIAIVRLPIDSVERFSRLEAVKKVSFGVKARARLDEAHKLTGVADIHSGVDLPRSYDGSGVVTGLVDDGVDPNHVAFTDSAGRQTRIGLFSTIYTAGANVTTYNTPSAISGFTTDDETSTHGTHVAGIMAGGAEAATGNGYYGVAKGSDIVMVGCGTDLYDTNILTGVEQVIDYALSQGKPAVVNLSLGINTGPHDGTDTLGRYLAECGRDGVICVSSGNEGDLPIVMSKTFTPDDKQLKGFVSDNETMAELGFGGYYTGYLDIWGDTDRAYSITLVLFDKSTGEIVYRMPTISSASGYMTYVSSPDYFVGGDISDDTFNNAFDGYMGAGSMVEASNDRYYTLVDYDLYQTSSNGGNIVMGLIIEGDDGQRVDAYCDGLYSEYSSYGVSGWGDDITYDGTINDMACGENIIAVGAFVSRYSWPDILGREWVFVDSDAEGDICAFTSWGKLIDGRELPDICAPGSAVVSSINKYYVDNYNYYGYSGIGGNNTPAAEFSTEERDNYWDAMAGTSMAAPYMAGVAALWLQADPTLTVDEIRDIARETAVRDSYVESADYPAQWGAGKLDALAGIKKILGIGSVGNVSADMEGRLLITALGGSSFEVYLAGESSLNVTLYGMSGIPVAAVSAKGDTAVIDAPTLAKGVYILSVRGERSNYSERVLVK